MPKDVCIYFWVTCLVSPMSRFSFHRGLKSDEDRLAYSDTRGHFIEEYNQTRPSQGARSYVWHRSNSAYLLVVLVFPLWSSKVASPKVCFPVVVCSDSVAFSARRSSFVPPFSPDCVSPPYLPPGDMRNGQRYRR